MVRLSPAHRDVTRKHNNSRLPPQPKASMPHQGHSRTFIPQKLLSQSQSAAAVSPLSGGAGQSLRPIAVRHHYTFMHCGGTCVSLRPPRVAETRTQRRRRPLVRARPPAPAAGRAPLHSSPLSKTEQYRQRPHDVPGDQKRTASRKATPTKHYVQIE